MGASGVNGVQAAPHLGIHRRRNTVRRERFHSSCRQGSHVGFVHL